MPDILTDIKTEINTLLLTAVNIKKVYDKEPLHLIPLLSPKTSDLPAVTFYNVGYSAEIEVAKSDTIKYKWLLQIIVDADDIASAATHRIVQNEILTLIRNNRQLNGKCMFFSSPEGSSVPNRYMNFDLYEMELQTVTLQE